MRLTVKVKLKQPEDITPNKLEGIASDRVSEFAKALSEFRST